MTQRPHNVSGNRVAAKRLGVALNERKPMNEKTCDGEIYTGKQYPSKPVVTYHFDHHEKEWVVRVHHKKGIYSICGCPGELEAQVVASALQRIADSEWVRAAERLFKEFIK